MSNPHYADVIARIAIILGAGMFGGGAAYLWGWQGTALSVGLLLFLNGQFLLLGRQRTETSAGVAK